MLRGHQEYVLLNNLYPGVSKKLTSSFSGSQTLGLFPTLFHSLYCIHLTHLLLLFSSAGAPKAPKATFLTPFSQPRHLESHPSHQGCSLTDKSQAPQRSFKPYVRRIPKPCIPLAHHKAAPAQLKTSLESQVFLIPSPYNSPVVHETPKSYFPPKGSQTHEAPAHPPTFRAPSLPHRKTESFCSTPSSTPRDFQTLLPSNRLPYSAQASSSQLQIPLTPAHPLDFPTPPKTYICATAPPLFTPQTLLHPSGSHLIPISPSALLSHHRHSCQCPALPALSPGTLLRMEEKEEKRSESPHCCYYVMPAWPACCNDTLAIVSQK